MITTESNTWQNAAESAVESIFEMTISNGFENSNTLSKFMRHRFDETLKSIENYNYVTDKSLISEGQSLWNFIGRHALMILRSQGVFINKDDIVSTLIRKQKDYGPENIARFGNIGLLIRMHDKIARLENILSKSNNNFNAAVNINAVSDETVIDTLIDIIGYSAIAIMWSSIDEDGNRKFLYKMG